MNVGNHPVALMAAAILLLPYGSQSRLVSPDGQWALYGLQYRQNAHRDPGLWIENLRTRRRQEILDLRDTLRAAWFPDSARFWVEDHSASDRTQAYIYDPATLRRLDLRNAVLAADPSAKPLDQGHRYYKVESVEPQSVLIEFSGHTDEAPVKCFDVRYRVTLAGAVSRLSRRMGPCQ